MDEAPAVIARQDERRIDSFILSSPGSNMSLLLPGGEPGRRDERATCEPRRPTVSTTPTVPDATQSASPLEKSRAKSTHARDGLEAAQRKLADLDTQLGRITAQFSSDETALRAATEEVKRLKKALKDGEKQRRKLLTARKRASDAAVKAEEKSHKAEAKYDRAVLADLIQRQKAQDRQAASAKAPANGAAASRPAGALPSGPSASTDTPALPAAPANGTQAEDLGTVTARETAARTTAESAGDSAAAAPRTTASPRSTTTRRAPAARSTSRTRTGRTTPSTSSSKPPSKPSSGQSTEG
jgi:archaellum component FlaC